MAHHNVPDFVGNHSGKLRLIPGSFHSPPIHVDEPAGQGKGVDRLRIDELELPGVVGFARCVAHQLFSQLVQVSRRGLVLDDGEFLVGLRCRFLAHFHILRRREDVESRLEFPAFGCKQRRRRHEQDEDDSQLSGMSPMLNHSLLPYPIPSSLRGVFTVPSSS